MHTFVFILVLIATAASVGYFAWRRPRWFLVDLVVALIPTSL